MREKIECIVPRLKMKKGGRKTKGRKEESDRQKKSKHRAREQGQHFLLLFFFFFSLHLPLIQFFSLLLWSQIWYSSQQSPWNNLPGVPATWKSITVIRRFCQANRNGGLRLCASACIYYECVCVQKGCGGVNHAWGGEKEEGWERCQTKRTRRESGSERDRAMRGGQRKGGWALCREEVICQIGFHSLLGLRAACQPGRLTLSDSPPCISTYAHMHTYTNSCTRTSAHTEQRVSEARRAFRVEHICCYAPITDSAIHYCVL